MYLIGWISQAQSQEVSKLSANNNGSDIQYEINFKGVQTINCDRFKSEKDCICDEFINRERKVEMKMKESDKSQ